MPAYRTRNQPVVVHGTVAVLLGLLGTYMVGRALGGGEHWATWLTAWLVAVNVTAFGYYGFDKARARSAATRVPEVVLHGLTAAGGSVGAYTGMQVFRHKTLKGQFLMLFWAVALFQAAALAWVIKVLWNW